MKKLEATKLPIKLNKKVTKLISDSYMNAIDEIGEEEFCYIREKIDLKIKATKHAAISWIRDLSFHYNLLYEIIEKNHKKRIISQDASKLIGAALFYFINPFDIIPDFTPAVGYVDDFYVLILCFKALKNKDKKIISCIMNEKAELC